VFAQAFHVANFEPARFSDARRRADRNKAAVGEDIRVDERWPFTLDDRRRGDAMIQEDASRSQEVPDVSEVFR